MTTWRDFKYMVESKGVTDNMVIDVIEVDKVITKVGIEGNTFYVL